MRSLVLLLPLALFYGASAVGGPTVQGSLAPAGVPRAAAPSGAHPTGTGQHAAGGACSPEWLPTFGGAAGLSGQVRALVAAPGSGSAAPVLYAGGTFASSCCPPSDHVVRWDGERWSALGGGWNGHVEALAFFDDGSGPALYAGGWFTQAGGGVPANRIAKWDGSVWSPLATGVSGAVTALVVFDDGTGAALYAGGYFLNASGVPAPRIARWDGSSWSSLGTGLNNGVGALAVHDDGGGPALYAGGPFTSAGGSPAAHVARWDGSAWTPVGVGTNDIVFALQVFDDGNGADLYAAGRFTTAGGGSATGIARWDGSSWTEVGGGLAGSARALGLYTYGGAQQLCVGGTFVSAGGIPGTSRVARWNGQTWANFADGVGTDSVNAFAELDLGLGTGPDLYVGGSFQYVGDLEVNYIARWAAGAWNALVFKAPNEQVRALASFDDGLGGGPALYAGGDFTSVGDLEALHVARWDGLGWAPLGSGMNVRVHALASFDDGAGEALYAGGGHPVDSNQPAPTVARWDGTSWTHLPSGPFGGSFGTVRAFAVFDDGSGPRLYAAGNTSGPGSDGVVAKWDAGGWTNLSLFSHPLLGSSVGALAVFDDGSGLALYAGGDFQDAGGVPANRIAKWDGTTWQPLAAGIPGPGYPRVNALEVFDDGSGPMLYAGGWFSLSEGHPGNHLARWNGSSWSPVGSGLVGSGNLPTQVGCRALTQYDDGNGLALYIGGTFHTAGGVSASSIARWDGAAWSALGGGLPSSSQALAVHVDGLGNGPALYVGGTFISAHDSQDARLAKWGCGLAVAYCFGDGTGTPCPCGNAGAPGHGCANSAGQGARLSASGTSSVAAADLVLSGRDLPAGQLGLVFQGTSRVNGGAGNVFGDGLRCAGGTVVRLEVVMSGTNGEAHTSIDLASQGGAAAGDIRTYQLWYRDSGGSPCGTNFNLSNGLELSWMP